MDSDAKAQIEQLKHKTAADRRLRADASRNLDSILEAALTVFASSGVDAPVREIAKRAGVGVGTLYRHFPQRSDLIAAVFRHEIDTCAAAADVLLAENSPGEALAKWMHRYAAFIAAKRGLAGALHSGDPAYEPLPSYFQGRLEPALRGLIEAATAAGEIRGGVDPNDLLLAVASLCRLSPADEPARAQCMIELLVDGLSVGAIKSKDSSGTSEF